MRHALQQQRLSEIAQQTPCREKVLLSFLDSLLKRTNSVVSHQILEAADPLLATPAYPTFKSKAIPSGRTLHLPLSSGHLNQERFKEDARQLPSTQARNTQMWWLTPRVEVAGVHVPLPLALEQVGAKPHGGARPVEEVPGQEEPPHHS